MKKSILFRLFAVVAAMMCALGIHAQEAYACYTSSNTTLTFYYDNQRSSRTGTTYDLNTGTNNPAWYSNGISSSVTRVVFNSSFAGARPTSTCSWFYNMTKLQSITGMGYLNTEEVTNMNSMFYDCGVLTSLNVSNFNTANVTQMGNMFAYCSGLTSLDLSNFNTANVTFMANMFGGCSGLASLNVSNFSTANVTRMDNMFSGCSGLTSLDLSSFSTANVTKMGNMFYGCSGLKTIYAGDGWSTAAVTSSSNMFFLCTSLVGGKGTTYNASHVNKTYAHIDGGPSNPGYFSEPVIEAYACYTADNTTLTFYYDNQRSRRPGTTYDLNTGASDTDWDTDGTKSYVTKVVFDPSFADARPTTTCDWFYSMVRLKSITGMNYLNTSEVTYMDYMFTDCHQLTSLDLSNFNTANVTDMRSMFAGCSGLTSLDLSSFNTSKVTNMYCMFNCSSNLRTIYVSDAWNTDAVTSSAGMFLDCTNLVGGMGTTYSSSHTNATYAHIDGGPSNPGYFTDKNASLRGDVNGDNNVSIADVTALIDLLLGGGTISNPAADCNQDTNVTIADVTALIDYLLGGQW